MLFYVFDAKESISEGFINFWLFVFEKRAILFKIKARALFNDFSHIKTDLLLNVTSPKENHMIDEHEKFQLFSIDTLPTVYILKAHFACHRVCTGVNKL